MSENGFPLCRSLEDHVPLFRGNPGSCEELPGFLSFEGLGWRAEIEASSWWSAARETQPWQLATHGNASPTTPRAILVRMDINARNIATPTATDASPAPTSTPMPVVGRFAPSPSGRMHLGNVFSCLCAWLSSRSQGGRIVLRIEDLDDRCKRPELAAQLIDDLDWLGLEWDEGPYYQHDRLDLYEAALHQLQDAGLTYPCFCTRAELHAASAPHASDGTPIYRGVCRGLSAEEIARRSTLRAPATRLRVPTVDDLADDVVEFVDRTYGAQCEALATECGDFLVRRSDGVFAYQLAVVVDDAAMGVTEVVRGCDLLGSTPRQIYLQHLLGLPTPHYAHIPLLMSPDGRRLSKRDRDLDLSELRARFGAPEALLGWLAGQTGIAPDATPRSAEQLVEHFSWDIIREHRENIVMSEGAIMQQTATRPDERLDGDIVKASTTRLSPEGFDAFCETLDSPMPEATKELLERKAAWE